HSHDLGNFAIRTLAVFGVAGVVLASNPHFVTVAAPLLCFVMGLQNATITKVSSARMRTTHMTGLINDIGIELGKLAYRNSRKPGVTRQVMADRAKLWLLGSLLGAFFLGGVLGTVGFNSFGFAAALPLAGFLDLLGTTPAMEAALVRRARSL
ncbi:YoaK family protein, partial [Teichococcus vastitatis]|uniref:YoaK family protein n=1 Tax=Teichococcus vastitatis TaxID=2307076 RepID=UPI0013007028